MQSTHCLQPLICNCLPVFDEICRRSINFCRDCIAHVFDTIKRTASYGIYYARNESPLGQNMSFCTDRYRSPLNSYYLVHVKSLTRISIAQLMMLNYAQLAFYLN